jgi:Flp pilus assembly protein TadG
MRGGMMPCPSPVRSRRWLRRLRDDRRGAVIVEFAICSAAFLALLLACAQTVLIFFAQQGLQTAAEGAARYILTGQATRNGMSRSDFLTYTCSKLPPFLDCAKVMIDVRKASSFTGIDATTPVVTYDGAGNITNNWQFDAGGSGDIMILRVMYVWQVQLGPLNLDFSNAGAGKRLLIGTMVFKSEPYTL